MFEVRMFCDSLWSYGFARMSLLQRRSFQYLLLRIYYFRDDRLVFGTVCSCIVDCCPSIHVETSRLVCCTLGSVDEADVILHENDTFTTSLVIYIFKHYYLLVTLNGFLEPPDWKHRNSFWNARFIKWFNYHVVMSLNIAYSHCI